jgi:mannose-6-phosphate isomerase
MANSDNVLRGGCTGKHVDPRELVKVLNFTSDDPILPEADKKGWYTSLVPEFQLAMMNLSAGSSASLRDNLELGSRPAIILVESGSLDIIVDGDSLSLSRGEAAFLAAGDQSVELRSPGMEAGFAVASVNRQ